MTLQESLKEVKQTLFPNIEQEADKQPDEQNVGTIIRLLREIVQNQHIILQRMDRHHAELTGVKEPKPKKEPKRFPTQKAVLEIVNASSEPMSSYEIFKELLKRNPKAKEVHAQHGSSKLALAGKIFKIRGGLYRRLEATDALSA